jgi:hypothetical protein
MNQFAPATLIDTLRKNAEYTNLPSIGASGNYAFPAIQANFAPAVPFSECNGELKYPLHKPLNNPHICCVRGWPERHGRFWHYRGTY